ncbi:MAG: hypothetical protein FH753_15995 [Firmicutes bacterium]|nr:hypothetical protein [Bacillota bacterium]
MEEENKFEVMRTYARAWQTEIVMYHLFGVPLWFPVSLRQAVFFMFGLVFSISFNRIIPIERVPLIGDPVCIYAVYPFLVMKFFTRMTLDGKPPHIYFKDQLTYLLKDKRYNMYRAIDEEENIKYDSNIGYRVIKLMSKIDYKLLKREGK